MPAKAQTTTVSVAKVGKILERSARFYENALWNSEAGQSVRARLGEAGIGPKVLREFEIGYAPVQPGRLLEHLAEWRYSAADLIEAGVVTRSGRKHLHARFHSRIMFPVRDRAGNLAGFAGLATHLGPSWPLWLASPENGRFQRSAALFGIDHAKAAIAEDGTAKVFQDCLEVLKLHASGEENAVAVIQSRVTDTHLELLAAELSIEPEDLGTLRLPGQGRASGSLTIVGPEEELEGQGLTPAEEVPMLIPGKAADLLVAESGGDDPVPEPVERLTPKQRVVRGAMAAAVGAGLPLIWLLLVNPSYGAGGERGYGFAMVALAVAASYGVLALVAARVAARARVRSTARRMRAPYLIGSTEWQPPAWTYHRIEDMVIAASVISMVILVVLLLTVGGFTGSNTSVATPWLA